MKQKHHLNHLPPCVQFGLTGNTTAAGVPVTITLPDTVPGRCEIGFTLLDNNRISFAPYGTALVLKASEHTKIRTLYSIVNARTFTDRVGLLSGDTGP